MARYNINHNSDHDLTPYDYPGYEVMNSRIISKMERRQNIRRAVVIMIIAAIVGAAFFIFYRYHINAHVRAFDMEKTQSGEVCGLSFSYPEEWEVVDTVEDDENNVVYEQDVNLQDNDEIKVVYRIKYLGNDMELMDAIKSDDEAPGEADSLKKINIDGCSEALRGIYPVGDSKRSYYLVRCDDSVFSIYIMGVGKYFYNEGINDLLDAILFTEYTSPALCGAEGCDVPLFGSERYCAEHRCCISGCSEAAGEGGFCKTHLSMEYKDYPVPDFGRIFGAEENESHSQELEDSMRENLNDFTYDQDGDNSYEYNVYVEKAYSYQVIDGEKIAEQYNQILEILGFKEIDGYGYKKKNIAVEIEPIGNSEIYLYIYGLMKEKEESIDYYDDGGATGYGGYDGE